MIDNDTYRRLKGRLTRAQNKGPVEVLSACAHAAQVFERDGYPDTWPRWAIAAEDAAGELMRAGRDVDARAGYRVAERIRGFGL